MKYISKILLFLTIVSVFFSFAAPLTTNAADSSINSKDDFRGLWVASVVNIDYPSKATTESWLLRIEALRILNYAKETGFNAIFLQVHPAADALYPSKYFPWSKYLTGKQGVAPSDGFDPLNFWITEAHKRGIELHAWINPYRITKRSAGEPRHNFASLHHSNPAIKNPGWVVKHSDGDLYFNPGIPAVRKLIVDGVMEIVNKYPVDGIHFDDYFYPGTDFNDKAAYNQYKTPGKSLEDWRRDNVNALVRDVYNAIKNTGKNVRFGISPFGIWANKSRNPLGSDTKGLESYYSHYADSLHWVKSGIIDYILPQIYWNIGYSIADYSKLVSWWGNAVSGTNVDLYIGHAAYKAGNSNPESPWYGTGEIEKQLKFNEKRDLIKGSVLFNYKVMAANPALTASIKAIYEMRDGKSSDIPVNISRPSSDISTSLTSFYLNGSSDPDKPLYLNGRRVLNRSSQGYFGILVQLLPGPNSFTLSQEGSYDTCSIYRQTPSSGPVKMSKAEIPAASVFPQSQEYRKPGEKVTLTCQAPARSKVTVKLNGKTYTMKQTTSVSSSGLYRATYEYQYTIPSFSGTPEIKNLGAPVYTFNYKGTVQSRKAPASIGAIMEGTPYYAEVTRDVIDTYDAPVTGNGAAYELYKGMIDSVTGMTGSYARLSSGQWVFKSQVKLFSLKSPLRPAINKAEYSTGKVEDAFKLTLSSPAAGIVSFDGSKLILKASAPSSASIPYLPSNSLISSVSVSKGAYETTFTLTKRAGETIEGYYIVKTDAGLELRLRRKAKAQNGSRPLIGITIMLDAGHGGSEPGAIGPLGLKYAEKDINLKLAFKLKTELEALGAKVMLTRTTDETVSLSKRLSLSRDSRPNMFISLHANSMPDNVDISKVFGFSVFYREALAKQLSQVIHDSVINELSRKKLGINKKNFYVTRGTWSPHILLESGFVPNPEEFEWLTSEDAQARLAKTISEGIIDYYSR